MRTSSAMDLLPILSGDASVDAIEPVLDNLYDVRSGGVCNRLSAGFVGSGILHTP